MRFPQPYSLKEVASWISAEFIGDPNFPVLGLNEIHRVQKGDIVFVDHPKYYDKALNSAASVVLINSKIESIPKGKAIIICDEPFTAFVSIGQRFNSFKPANSVQSNSAKVGKNTIIQPGAFIGNNVTIGNNCTIHPNVVLYDGVQIGNEVVIHAGTVIGSDAFYFKKRPNSFEKLKSIGSVIIKDNVEIGANCTIDRGVTDVTQIGEGTKLDNQIQIGHDTIIGKRCLIASHTGIAGCVIIGDEVTIWGQVGITSGITIGDKTVIGAQSGVGKSLEGGKLYIGSPAEDSYTALRKSVALKRVNDFIKGSK